MATQLNTVPLFSHLAAEALTEVANALQPQTLAASAILFNQGDPGDELYLVESGQVAIFAPDPANPGSESPIRVFQAGQIFGEMALIDHKPRSLSARALTDSQMRVLNGEDFRRLLRDYPDIALQVMAGLNERIRYTTDFLGEVQDWVKRVAEGKYEREFKPEAGYKDATMEELAADFAQMAAQVQKREQELQREIYRLQVKIDHEKRERQVSEITETDYFQTLRTRAKDLREQNAAEDEAEA